MERLGIVRVSRVRVQRQTLWLCPGGRDEPSDLSILLLIRSGEHGHLAS